MGKIARIFTHLSSHSYDELIEKEYRVKVLKSRLLLNEKER